MRLLCCAALCAIILSAATVSGRWHGTATYVVNGTKQTSGIYLSLTQTGPKITGTANEPVGNKVTPTPIENGKVAGKTVSFTAVLNNIPETFELNMVDANSMSGKMTGGGKTANVQVRLDK